MSRGQVRVANEKQERNIGYVYFWYLTESYGVRG